MIPYYPAIQVIETVIFVIMLLTTAYIFIFSVFSLRGTKGKFPKAKKLHRMVVLFPAYKEDRVIKQSVESILSQTFSRDKYDVAVISDKMEEQTNLELEAMGVKVFRAAYKDSSKAKALNLAMDELKGSDYELVVILDADNVVQENFLEEINNAYHAGIKAIQTHRRAKNLNTDTAVLDAVSEEMNNSIFRKGHVSLGLSSALIGSGMAFEYKWFEKNIRNASSAGEDKELEVMLLKQGIYIEYLDHVIVFDEKTTKDAAFYNQRRRWLAAQFSILFHSIKDLPGAIFSGNLDYTDKLVQWMMPTRVMTLFIIAGCGAAICLVDWIYSVKWWILLLFLLFSLSIAIPDYLVDRKFSVAIKKIPLLGIMMILNMFRLRGVNSKFIHTEHAED